jgi:predicted regulator of Ras-like GTPase activity (Roadblock/LC7/MglB family)
VTEPVGDDGRADRGEHGDRLQEVLRTILDESFGIAGALVATVDGLFVAGEVDVDAAVSTRDEAETLSAMAAATVNIGMRVVEQLSLGTGTGCVVQASEGCVGVHRLGARGVLVMFGGDGLTAGSLNVALRRALPRVQEALASAEA